MPRQTKTETELRKVEQALESLRAALAGPSLALRRIIRDQPAMEFDWRRGSFQRNGQGRQIANSPAHRRTMGKSRTWRGWSYLSVGRNGRSELSQL